MFETWRFKIDKHTQKLLAGLDHVHFFTNHLEMFGMHYCLVHLCFAHKDVFMYIYVCMYISIYVCNYVYMYVDMYVYIYIYLCLHVCMCNASVSDWSSCVLSAICG